MSLDIWCEAWRVAVRSLLRRPAFSALVIVTLALGVGAASSVFALVDAVLLRTLPYRDPARLTFIWQTLPEQGVIEVQATPFDFDAWRGASSFSSLALVQTGTFTLSGTDEPERVRGARMTATMMGLLGVSPLGRALAAGDEGSGAPDVLVISDGLWRRRFGADTGLVGRSIHIDGRPHTVVGILPRGIFLPGPLAGDDEVWLPLRLTPAERANATSHNYTVVARLKDGATFDSASAETAAIAGRLSREYPATHRALGVRLTSIPEQTVHDIRPALGVLMAGVGVLLLVACTNVSTLLVARSSSRSSELAVRAALGATGGQLRALGIAESALFAVLGSALGIALAWMVLGTLVPLFADALPRAAVAAIDWRVGVFAAACALGATTLLATATSRRAVSERVSDALRSGRAVQGRSTARRGRMLVVAQVALAVLLLATAGVLVKSFSRLQHARLGFDPDHLLTFRISLPSSAYPSSEARATFTGALVDRLSRSGSVVSAGLNSRLPLGGSRGANGISIEGRVPQPGERLIADQREVSPAYFSTLGIRVLEGRGFEAQDRNGSEPVAVVNQTMAKRFWPDGRALDQRVRVNEGTDRSPWLRIVGVIDDVRHMGLARSAPPEMYRVYSQAPATDFAVVVRTAGDPAAFTAAARDALRALDPSLPLYDIQSMEARVARSVAPARAIAILLLSTAALAALLAGIAIYGSVWYSVVERLPEIGVRVALGATRRSIYRLAIGGTAMVVAVGAAIGIAITLMASPLLAGILYDTHPRDVTVHVAVAFAVVILTIAASAVPARRALRVDPLISLRQ